MLNLRYIFRLIRAFLNRYKLLLILGIIFGILTFFVIGYLLPSISFNNTIKIGETGRYTPDKLPPQILDLIGNGLTKIDSEGNVVPDLASSWETTDKGKTWTFTLKDNIYWQDGKKVDSNSINYQFTDVTIERPDDKTISFKLQNAYSTFPSVVSRPIFKTGLLGTGEYKVSKISLSGAYVQEISLVSKNKKDLIYKFYPTEESTKVAFELGDVDKIEDLFSVSPFDTWDKVKKSSMTDYGEFVAVFFNTQEGILQEKNIRQALSYAIDKTNLGGVRAISPISIKSWAYNPQVKPYNYDPVKAKQMIDDYKESSKISELNITLSTPPLLYNKAEIIAKNWQAVGVNVNVQVISTIPTDFQSFLAIFDIPDDPDQYSIWHSTQTSTNITKYQNSRIDKLLEDGRSEIDLETRKKIYLDFQRFLLEDAPAAFLYYPTTFTVSRN